MSNSDRVYGGESEPNNDAVAQFRFGNALHDGTGREVNYGEAVKWWRKAADQNILSAQNALGRAYEKGEGVEKNPEEAANWYRKAAEQGNGDAQKALGILYQYGKGVPQDQVEAYFWFDLADEHYKGDAVLNQTEMAKHMSVEQVEQAREKVKQWKTAHQTAAAAPQQINSDHVKQIIILVLAVSIILLVVLAALATQRGRK